MNAFPTPKHLACGPTCAPATTNPPANAARADPEGLQVARATLTDPRSLRPEPRTPISPPPYQRLRGRRGHPKAVTAVGRSILAAWHMLQTGELYRDLGGDH
jgi:transposase